MKALEIFWDVGSPYSHIAVAQVESLRQRTGASIRLRPFLLGGVFKATGNNMPALVPAKATYMLADLRRLATRSAIPMKLPGDGTPFPINSLLPMRAAMAAELEGQGAACCHALFAAYWGDGRDVSQPEILAEALTAAGLNAAAVLDAAATQPVKDALRASTDEAVQRGAFGAPAMFLGDEHFWGQDRMFLVEERLRGDA